MSPALLLSLLVLGSGHYVSGLDRNGTVSGKGGLLLPGAHSAGDFQVTTRSEMLSPASTMPSSSEPSSGAEEDYSEEDDAEPGTVGYIVDDSVRVEQVVKPKKNKTESEKTSDKPKRRKKGNKNGKRRNKKKKNPCAAEFQNFCIHGECKYLENMDRVTCQCDQDYFGERCGEKSMKTHRIAGHDLSKIALAAIAAFVSAVSLTAIAVVVTAQIRKRYFREYAGEEERKKLRQENGTAHGMA